MEDLRSIGQKIGRITAATQTGLDWKKVLMTVGVGLFLFFVWPTPYEYTRKAPNIWRTNRFTGVKEQSTSDGWRRESEVAATIAKAREKEKLAEEAETNEKMKLAGEQSRKVVFRFKKDWFAVPYENPTDTSFKIKAVTVTYWTIKNGEKMSGENLEKLSGETFDPLTSMDARSEGTIDTYDLSKGRNHPPEVSQVLGTQRVIEEVKIEFWTDGYPSYGPFFGKSYKENILGSK
jgi:hypothetical protein